ncbi:hypothetical protein LJC68_04275 [Bacteroidales bacterium OttesenSCG-928-B11]|nr:hypothetical protein [Bacteroidales bacterium OttesenSCG-928-E04]MDL2308798.1 hypothetical protein [Bacteroidales bacterium OttesenSCG-928-C03]MDL2312076.1 hypothetical protein [Bacteroidales bacterium OttesenSCG-928-B11]MDL2325686.1 hypothetical protein [Bacteroidales bacterium OttesenSCG-928-A14]
MKRNNKIYLAIAIVLIIISVVIILFENGVIRRSGQEPPSDSFAIKDTSLVTKIFIADMAGNNILLSRSGAGWLVNDSLLVMQQKIEGLLGVMQNLMIREPVTKTARQTINSALAVGGIKVEVYQIAPKFSLLGIKFGNKERLVKTYYMGPATEDNLSNFAVLEGLDIPYIVHVPGFRGFVTPQYSQFEIDWISHNVFDTKITRIQELVSQDLENPEESFRIVKAGPRSFDLFNYENQKIMNYDTLKVIDMLSEYRNKNFESVEKYLSSAERDSVLNYHLFKIITLIDVEGKSTEMKAYHLQDYANEPEMEIPDPSLALAKDRFYGVINGNQSQLYKMQYYHFDRQMQPLSYFLKDE